jgi:hypothetical protein
MQYEWQRVTQPSRDCLRIPHLDLSTSRLFKKPASEADPLKNVSKEFEVLSNGENATPKHMAPQKGRRQCGKSMLDMFQAIDQRPHHAR